MDEATKEAQRQQLNAERKRRAKGDKRSIELKAEAELFRAQKEAEAVKVGADAEAYAVRIQAEAEAAQTTMLAAAINKNGKAAIDFEVAKPAGRRHQRAGRLAWCCHLSPAFGYRIREAICLFSPLLADPGRPA